MRIRTYSRLNELAYQRDNYTCQYCDRDCLKNMINFFLMDTDFVVPLNRGGENRLENTVTACKMCIFYKKGFNTKFDFNKGPIDFQLMIKNARNCINKKRNATMLDLRSARESRKSKE